jgi:hypothetical protein
MGDIHRELWISWASLLRSYAAVHNLTHLHQLSDVRQGGQPK